ncbi:MAG: hypothetical protein ABSA67_05240 [Candidatus Brocadiia bacterium]|jgi:hypothetical protein
MLDQRTQLWDNRADVGVAGQGKARGIGTFSNVKRLKGEPSHANEQVQEWRACEGSERKNRILRVRARQ